MFGAIPFLGGKHALSGGKHPFHAKIMSLGKGMKLFGSCYYCQNGRHVPILQSLGFKRGIFPNDVRVGVPKILAKICIFEGIGEEIFQLSVEHSVFHLKFISLVTVVVQTLFIILLKIWNVARKKENTFNC